MAEKHIEMMRKKTDGTFDIYYPKTKAELVIMPGGGDLAHDYVRSPGYGTAIGTNDKTITLSPAPTAYVEGMAISFKNQTQNTGAVTLNVNGLGAKSVLKPNGNALASDNLKANSVYTVRYNGTAFILQGEGGEYGTAGPAHVLVPYTIGTENGIVPGTMVDRGAVNQTITTQNGQYIIPQGYHNGSGRVTATFANLVAGNVKRGVNIGGVVGTLNDQLFLSAPTQRSTNQKNVEVKKVTVNVTGTILVLWRLWTPNNSFYANSWILKNGVIQGDVNGRGTYNTSPSQFSQQVEVNSGDVISLRISAETGPTWAILTDNFEVRMFLTSPTGGTVDMN